MENATPQLAPVDCLRTGIASLCYAARSFEIHATVEQVFHALGLQDDSFTVGTLIQAAAILDLTAREHRLRWGRLRHISWPAIALFDNGQYVVIVRADDEQVWFHDPLRPGSAFVAPRAEFEAAWSGTVILMRARATSGTGRSFGFPWFFAEVGKHRKVLVEVFLAAFALQLFGLAAPLFSQVIIDKVVVHRNLATLHVLGIGMTILMLFEAALTFLQSYLTTHTASRIDVVLGTRVVRHLLRLPLKFFEQRRIGNIVSHVRELDTVRQFITGASVGALLDVLSIVILVPLMFFYSTTLAWVVLATLPLFVASSLILIPMMRARLETKFRLAADSQSFLVESVSGMQTIKSLAIEPGMEKRWGRVLARYVHASYRAAMLASVGSAAGQLIQKGSNLAILWLGAQAVLDGSLSVGQLIAFQMLSGRVIQPIVRVSQLWQEFQQMSMAITRIGDIMNTPTERRSLGNVRFQGRLRGAVLLDRVRFGYQPGAEPVLNGISLDIAAGRSIGIVGRSGSGKSTLSKLLQCLYQPDAGRILIDGHDIRLMDPAFLRSQIGVVLQENFLFDGTIRDNIAIHFPTAPAERLIQAAIMAGAHDFIMGFPDGYDTPVGERGIALSGGQRQRIAIARALLGDPRILVFDEATSALDYESERIIQQNLRTICNGRTVFIIAHRLSTVQGADTILVLDKGTVVETGTHSELLTLGGLYSHLFSQQAAEAA